MKVHQYLMIITFIFFFLLGCSNDSTNTSQGGIKEDNTFEQEEHENIESEKEFTFPLSKEMRWKSEGTIIIEKGRLVSPSDLPFITYIPEKDWTFSQHGKSIEILSKYGNIEITFYDEGTSEQTVKDHINKIINSYPEILTKETIKSEWFIDSYRLYDKSQPNISEWKFGRLFFGQYDHQFFYIYSQLTDMSGGEIFIPIEHSIYQEWRWKTSNEALNIEFSK